MVSIEEYAMENVTTTYGMYTRPSSSMAALTSSGREPETLVAQASQASVAGLAAPSAQLRYVRCVRQWSNRGLELEDGTELETYVDGQAGTMVEETLLLA